MWKMPICALPPGWQLTCLPSSPLLSRGTDFLFSAFSESQLFEPKLMRFGRPTYNKIIKSTIAKAISKARRLGGVTPDTVVPRLCKKNRKEYGFKETQTPLGGNNLGLCL